MSYSLENWNNEKNPESTLFSAKINGGLIAGKIGGPNHLRERLKLAFLEGPVELINRSDESLAGAVRKSNSFSAFLADNEGDFDAAIAILTSKFMASERENTDGFKIPIVFCYIDKENKIYSKNATLTRTKWMTPTSE